MARESQQSSVALAGPAPAPHPPALPWVLREHPATLIATRAAQGGTHRSEMWAGMPRVCRTGMLLRTGAA